MAGNKTVVKIYGQSGKTTEEVNDQWILEYSGVCIGWSIIKYLCWNSTYPLFIIRYNPVQMTILIIYQGKNFNFILWKQCVMNM